MSVRFVALVTLCLLASCKKEAPVPVVPVVAAPVVDAAPVNPVSAGQVVDLAQSPLGTWAREMFAQTGPAYQKQGHLFCQATGKPGAESEFGAASCEVEMYGVIKSFPGARPVMEPLHTTTWNFSFFGDFMINTIADEGGGKNGSNQVLLRTQDVAKWTAFKRPSPK